MKKETIKRTLLKYLKHLNSSEWIVNEAYKFEFASYIYSNLDFNKQTDKQILSILLKSQTIKYDRSRGIQFIQKSGRETLNTFIQLGDIPLFRQFQNTRFEIVDWRNRSMSFTALALGYPRCSLIKSTQFQLQVLMKRLITFLKPT